MREHIIDFLTLGGQHTRSISLDRDLYDNQAIEGYLLTPNSVGALRQISEGLIQGHAQRAWKIVGPYGSGKSALGVILAQLMAGPHRHGAAAKVLASVAPTVADHFSASNRFTLAVVGSRVSFGLALATAIDSALQNLGKAKAFVSLRKQLDITKGTYKGLPINAAAGELAEHFATAVVEKGYQGLTLLIDEVGKFVEHAALYPEQGDLIALQQVAEHACKANDDKLVVVAMLHQHFASYAAGVGRALNDEWHKVAARFEEVPFDEPIERYAYFAKHALGVKPVLLKNKTLVAESKAIYAQALALGILRPPSVTDKKLFDRAEGLYPLHPLTLAALATVSKRYGQSERSFHAFLKGNEPKGLRDFSQRHTLGSWYQLTDLYDFLADGYGLRFRDLGAERRWEFAVAAVARVAQDAIASAALKTLAVLELVQSGINVPATVEVIAYALDTNEITSVTTALARLVEQGVLIKRRKQAEYSLAVPDAVNIEALYEEAARANEGDLIVSGISKALSQRLVVANRHYDVTGTIRTLGIQVGTPEAWPHSPAEKSEGAGPDGWLKLVLVTKGSEAETKAYLRLPQEQDVLSVSACLALSTEGRAALAEFAIWQTVLREINSKHLDPWTTRYVEGRLQEASEAVERLVTSALMPSKEHPGPTYWHIGKAIPGSMFMNASQLASWLFDQVYHQTPRIVNELINKDRPASAIVLARQRMFDVILSGDPTRKICGDTEYPPERLIHASLLRNTGIWQETDGRWSLHAPTSSSPSDITDVWLAISHQLRAMEPQSFAQVLEVLAAPPLGVRSAPAGIWVALYLLVNRSRCAVFERGTLVLELTAEHLQRMFKNPQSFTMRELLDADESKKLLADYRAALSAIGCALEKDVTYLEIARGLIRWFTRLPDFTKQTQRISKDAALVRSILGKATDPIELLTQTLCRAHLESKSKDAFVVWLTNALTDLGMAYRRLQDDVAAELGQGFSISGPLSRVRNQLQAECTKEGSKLADAKLKSFILRCTDLVLTDEKWLDSVGSLIVQRPLDSWIDDTLSKFQGGLTELCGKYQRWMRVVMRRGTAPRAADRFVGLTLTMAGGEESSVFVATNESSTAIAKNVLALVAETTQGNTQLAVAALAQALLDLQTEVNKNPVEEARHG
ncbi:MAG: hypothetical protein KKA22_16780 [Gammaproteobacteria bacterium]|nr:hypothetical protein [Gammaproteobacteria bacterium]MBU1409793.1 hypothetical protein [Gammaproteobacteria bacterium]